MITASPWAALLRGEPIRLETRAEAVEPQARCGTKLAGLLELLAQRDSATKHTLSVCADLTSRQVWGLLKAPRDVGQVRFDEEVEFIRISRKQWRDEWADPRPAPNVRANRETPRDDA